MKRTGPRQDAKSIRARQREQYRQQVVKRTAHVERKLANKSEQYKAHHKERLLKWANLKPRKLIRWEEKVKALAPLYRMYSAKRRAARIEATPSWITAEHILPIYQECHKRTIETGVLHHVDHIVPLRGKKVCGLHVYYNLQVITARANLSKGNRFTDG